MQNLSNYNKSTSRTKISSEKYNSIFNNAAKLNEFLAIIGSTKKAETISYKELKDEIRYKFGRDMLKNIINSNDSSAIKLVQKALNLISFNINDFSRWVDNVTIAKYQKAIAPVKTAKIAAKKVTAKNTEKVEITK